MLLYLLLYMTSYMTFCLAEVKRLMLERKKKKKEREAEKTLSLILPVVPSSFFMLIAYSPTTRTQLHTVAQKGFLVCFVFVLVCLFLMLTTLIHESPPSFYGICIHKGRPETLPSAVILSAVIFICSSFT